MFPGGCLLFEPADLDIFTTRSKFMHVIRFFNIAAGYVIISSSPSEDYHRTGQYLRVFRMQRPESTLTVNILVTLADNPMVPVFRFHLTIVMNSINGKGASSYTAFN